MAKSIQLEVIEQGGYQVFDWENYLRDLEGVKNISKTNIVLFDLGRVSIGPGEVKELINMFPKEQIIRSAALRKFLSTRQSASIRGNNPREPYLIKVAVQPSLLEQEVMGPAEVAKPAREPKVKRVDQSDPIETDEQEDTYQVEEIDNSVVIEQNEDQSEEEEEEVKPAITEAVTQGTGVVIEQRQDKIEPTELEAQTEPLIQEGSVVTEVTNIAKQAEVTTESESEQTKEIVTDVTNPVFKWKPKVRCAARTAEGRACRKYAIDGSPYCSSHQNYKEIEQGLPFIEDEEGSSEE